ncbi:MAG: CarD family transcriptional regulator [Alphaproteobacteria bacterium]|nr:CarD family transcriptional regulator [Alphaproteobacteria bacterium]
MTQARKKSAAKATAKKTAKKSPAPARAASVGAAKVATPPRGAKIAKVVPPPKPAKVTQVRRKLAFAVNDHVVYPTHGVGQVTSIEEREIAGQKLELYVVTFEKDKMTLRVPVSKAANTGMRKLASPQILESAITTLKGRARVKRTMWSRRAQEYEAKINSGDPISIAEVVRDLHRSASQPEQSYSERQIYEAALDRLVREIAAVERIDEAVASERVQKVLRAA